MKIVVTGALGHIGSKLIRTLPAALGSGTEITLIDDLSTQRYPSLFSLPREGRYDFIEGDVTRIPLAPLFQGARAVVHLAAITNAADSFANKEKVENINFTATEKVAEACAQSGIPLFFASTTSVYGTQNEEVDEDCSPAELKPQSPYAASKLREEQLIQTLTRTRGLKSVTCRFGTIFGTSPGMRFHTAVNKFCWQATFRQPVTVWRTALKQVRPYLDLGDAIRVMHFFIEREIFDGRIYNALTLNATVEDILNVIALRVPDLEIRYVDEAIMNQFSYRVGRRRIESLGFQFKGDLKLAILETFDFLWNARRAG